MDSSDDEQIIAKSRKRISTLDSDDDESDAGNNSSQKNLQKKIEEKNDDDDNDSESESGSNESKLKKKSTRRAVFADSDDDDIPDMEESGSNQNSPSNKIASSKKFSNKSSSDDSSEDEGIEKKSVHNDESSSSNVSDSEGELNEKEEIAKIEEQSKKSKAKPMKRQDRKTKDAAMKEIYSESQRMFRESGLKVGYHRPKQRTLDEFLNRKKKHLISEVINDIKIRKPPENPDEVQRQLEEMEKETEEFYKNEDQDQETDDDEEETADPNIANAENETAEPSSQSEQKEVEDATNTIENSNDKNQKLTDLHQNPESSSPIETDLTVSKIPQEKTSKIDDHADDSGIVPNSLTTDESASNSDNENSEQLTEKCEDPQGQEKVNEKPEEEPSLNLFLEPDTEKLTDEETDNSIPNSDELILNSQKTEIEQTVSEKEHSLLSKKLENLSKTYDLSSQFQLSLLSKKPKLAKPVDGGGEIIFNEKFESSNDGDKNDNDLLKRFVKHASASSKLPPAKAGRRKNVDINVIKKTVDSKGNEALESEVINYKVNDLTSAVSKVKNTDKPGAQLLVLKKKLKEKILEKKKNEWEKREKEQAEDNEEEDGDDAEFDVLDDEDLDDEEHEYDDEESSEGESEPETEDEDAYVKSDKKLKRVKNAFIDDEAEEEDDIEFQNDDPEDQKQQKENIDEEDTMHLTLDDDDVEDVEKEQPNNDIGTPLLSGNGRSQSRINPPATPFSDMNFIDGTENSIRWTPFDERTNTDEKEKVAADKNVCKKLGFESLFDTSDPHVMEIDDVVGLCSGQFVTQKPMLQETQSQAESQDISATPDTVILPQSYSNTQSQELSLSDFPVTEESTHCEEYENAVAKDTINHLSFVGSDEDGENNEDLLSTQTMKKKKVKRLVLSDDESDLEENDNKNDNDSENDNENDEEKEVMYDSEENEVEVPVFKGFVGKKGIRKEFVDNEAELSGSEVGSDDEDERGLDRMLQEEGDFDQLDHDQVRDEVGRIHHRQILDQDKREVRLFQEAFLEDGELHSDNTRARKFHWKNIDDDNYDMSLKKSDSEGEDDLTEEEEKRRLERLDRQKWVQENEDKEKNSMAVDEGDDEGHDDSQFFNMASKALKRLNSRKSTSIPENNKPIKDTKVFKSPKSKTPLQILSGNKKGSFLSREEETLEKLAEMTRNKSEAKTGVTAKNTNNFVFTARSPSKTELTDEDKSKETKKSKSKATLHKQGPPQKKAKVSRTLDENSQNTIFGLIN